MTAEFIAEEGILKGLVLSLERGEEWTIGRDPDLSSIVIEDPKASRLHMRVTKRDDGYYVENLSDTNPILIGETPVSAPTLLHEGDIVTIGGSHFRFYPEGAPTDIAFEAEYPYSEGEAFTEEPSVPENYPEEEGAEDTLFEEPKMPESPIDLTQTTRFILKVIAGPNTGAEFALDTDHSYLIGTDTSTCDIIFNDLSVSREHARLNVNEAGDITIQDLNSRNGVIVDKERIIGTKPLSANAVVALGTSAFLLIDREAPSETIAAPLYEAPEEEEAEEQAIPTPAAEQPAAAAVMRPKKAPIPVGGFVLSLIICSLAILLGIGLVSLLKTEEISVPQKDKVAELNAILKNYPAVRYTYNPHSGKLFLLGDVKTGVEHNELLYQLKGLPFITGLEDNIVNDEAVWQEMNILLSKHPDFKGVSMHSPEAGVFVITGYLQTDRQAAELTDYLNINFNYLSRLQNRVIVEQEVEEEVTNKLLHTGFNAVNASFMNGNGVLTLKGYISSAQVFDFDKLLDEFKKIPGVRVVNNLVVPVTPEQGVIDLNVKYQAQHPSMKTKEGATVSTPPRYRVTGYSTHGDTNVNVVINGRILSRGDCIDGYTITSIQPNTIFLEKDGLKYKIDYKCKNFGMEE